MAKMKIKKGDRVVVISGKDKGREGEVLQAFPQENKVIVEGVAVVKKAQRPTQANQQGGIVEKEAKIHVSNVALLANDGKATRVGYRINEDGTKSRIAKRTGDVI